MITLKEFMELVDYRITEGTDYGWHCYGSHAHTLDSWSGDQNGHSVSIVFDTKTQEVYEVTAYDYKHQRAYRMINADHRAAHVAEAVQHGYNADQAWDDVDYCDLETDDDFVQKTRAIVAGEDYDTRVSVPVDFSDEELLTYMKLAHERDITFNQMVEQALREAIDEYKRDPQSMQDRARSWQHMHQTASENPIDFPAANIEKNKKALKDKKKTGKKNH